MREKNDLKSLTVFDDFIQVKRDVGWQQNLDCLQRQQDVLHHEIKRGKEHLLRVQNELDESRASLEQWNRYELISSTHPLDHLIQTMALQEKTQRFLVGWLKRKQEKLAKLREDIECSSRRSPKFGVRPTGSSRVSSRSTRRRP